MPFNGGGGLPMAAFSFFRFSQENVKGDGWSETGMQAPIFDKKDR
jgi:hypothetical protein